MSIKPVKEKVRIDKWLWAVRLFKTRSLAAEACDKGKVSMQEQEVKPARVVKMGDVITIRKGAFKMQFQVLQLTDKRMAASLVPGFCKDLTPEDVKEKMTLHAIALQTYRNHSEGRPTKKERRSLDDFLEWE